MSSTATCWKPLPAALMIATVLLTGCAMGGFEGQGGDFQWEVTRVFVVQRISLAPA